MKISLIVAMSENGVIGRAGQLPWRLSSDLRRFKRLTMGHTLIMGRKTFASIGRPLPGRRSIVVSRRAEFSPGGAERAANLEQALEMAGGDSEVFFIGGAEIYRHALPRAERLYEQIARAPGLTAAGLHVYDGHLHQPSRAERSEAVRRVWQDVVTFRDRLSRAGLDVPRIVAGGTGTFPVYAEMQEPSL
jgi:dihydrofolate reductase